MCARYSRVIAGIAHLRPLWQLPLTGMLDALPQATEAKS